MASTVPVKDINAVGATERNDGWWIEPLLVFLGLGAFIVYATWAAIQGEFYAMELPEEIVVPDGANAFEYVRPYLSPICSPDLPRWFPEAFGWYQLSPAFLILPFPGLFRATCYYYRKAYYRAFFTTPAACSVGGQPMGILAWLLNNPLGRWFTGKKPYTGETVFPMAFQNLHRFTFYIAALFMLILAYDAFQGFFGWQHVHYADGQSFHVGVGSLVILLNVIFLGLYTFSCHSWRHLLAGKLDCFSCSDFTKARYNAWKRQSFLNEHHMLFAWVSLVWVGFTDLYIRLCAMGIWQDRILF